MTSFTRALVLVLSAAVSIVLTTGCAKSNSEHSKSNADSAISDLKRSASELDAMGVPNSNWSDADMLEYERRLNATAHSANRVQSADGKDGVIIVGSYSLVRLRQLLASRRYDLRMAREKKAAAVAATNAANAKAAAAAAAPTDPASLKQAKINELQASLRMDGNNLDEAGQPDANWPEAKLKRYGQWLDRMEKTVGELETLNPEAAKPLPPEKFETLRGKIGGWRAKLNEAVAAKAGSTAGPTTDAQARENNAQ